MTVAKSQVYSTETTPVAEADSTRDGILTMWLEAIGTALSDYWQTASPELQALAEAAWQRALCTRPKTLLICAALCFMGSFGVMLVALFAAALTTLLKLGAITLAGIAIWQWLSQLTSSVNRSLRPQRQIASAKQSIN